MNASPNESLHYRHRRFSLNVKSKNQAIPLFSNLPEPQAGGLSRNKRPSMGPNQLKSIKLTKSSRTIQPSSRNLGSTKDIQNAVSYLTFKDILKNNNQKSNLKLTNYEIIIRALSNYGHESLITSGEIDVLDQNQATIRNVTCSVSTNNESTKDKFNENDKQIPEEKSPKGNNSQSVDDEDISNRLVNQSIIKNSFEETWTHDWREPEKNGLDIKLLFKSQKKPHFIRIFPSTYISEANIKDIRIYVNEKFIYEGTLNQTFCSVIELHYEGACATDLPMYIKNEDKVMPHVLRDSFGILPFSLTREISISIIESYYKITNLGDNSNNSSDQLQNSIIFGIRKIAFFTTNGEMVKPSMMEANSRNIKCFQPLPQLFTDEITLASNQPWKGSYMDDNEILITFTDPLPIAAIGILSPSIHTTLSKTRVKKMAVKVNGVMRWVGQIINNTRESVEQNDDNDSPFYIYLTNHIETKKKIPKYFS